MGTYPGEVSDALPKELLHPELDLSRAAHPATVREAVYYVDSINCEHNGYFLLLIWKRFSTHTTPYRRGYKFLIKGVIIYIYIFNIRIYFYQDSFLSP